MATKLCFICRKSTDIADNEYLCEECAKKRINPPHIHDFKPFKFSETSNVTYYDCKCGERRMTATDA